MIRQLDKALPDVGIKVLLQLLKQSIVRQLSFIDHGTDLVDHPKEVHHEAVAGVGDCQAAMGRRDVLQWNCQNWVQCYAQLATKAKSIANQTWEEEAGENKFNHTSHSHFRIHSSDISPTMWQPVYDVSSGSGLSSCTNRLLPPKSGLLSSCSGFGMSQLPFTVDNSISLGDGLSIRLTLSHVPFCIIPGLDTFTDILWPHSQCSSLSSAWLATTS